MPGLSAPKLLTDLTMNRRCKNYPNRTCAESLRSWSKGKMKSLPFGTPIVWREETDHVTDCYFGMTNLKV
ncbi:uncharacterized protein LOC143019501 isoform X3 [Oratosquilla oratoria]|uniref:uncharacterized protein LOC143019501 isoform X3 n=1 Tax=Oratosquilla oratoria TaxID=337810 RepID=UPI003F7632E0